MMQTAELLPNPGPWLDYGPLGALALISIVVLGVNVWKLYALIGEGNAAKMRAAKPLLFGVMAFSAFGLAMAMGAFLFYDRGERTVTLVLLPSLHDVTDARYAPEVRMGDKALSLSQLSGFIHAPREAGKDVSIHVDYDPYINWRVSQASGFATRAATPADLAPVDAGVAPVTGQPSLADLDPQVN